MGNRNGHAKKNNGENVDYSSNYGGTKTSRKPPKTRKRREKYSDSLPRNDVTSKQLRGISQNRFIESSLTESNRNRPKSIDIISSINSNSQSLTNGSINRQISSSLTSRSPIYIANYDFHGSNETGELSFRKGDKLEIYDRKSYKDWWRALNLESQLSGYVPSNYISPIDDLNCHEWYFGETTRRDAERFLHQPHNAQGTFLIRPSDSVPGHYALSLLDLNQEKHFHVKHYRIRRTPEGLFFISERRTFATLLELIDHYKIEVDGLCCKLTQPCRQIEPTVPADRHGLLELDRSQLKNEQLIGKGNYGEVYRGTYGQRQVAIKAMKTETKNRLCNVEKFIDEAKIMKDLLHKNIVRLYGVCTEEEPIFIVTEYMSQGSLLNHLREDQGKLIKFKTIIDYGTQIACGMSYLEEKRYVHCDLAARNILVGELNLIKIGDFGLAKILQSGRLIVDREAQFPIKWTAPEAATRKEYTTKSDVWSFGILLFELITYGSNPYPGMSNNEALQAVLRGYRMAKPPDCNEYYHHLMSMCWHENPDDRPTFETLYARLDDFSSLAEPSYRDT